MSPILGYKTYTSVFVFNSLWNLTQKNRYGHFHSYLTIAFEFFDTPNTKIITNEFSTNFEKMAVRRGLSKVLHGLKVDAIFKWVNRVQFD